MKKKIPFGKSLAIIGGILFIIALWYLIAFLLRSQENYGVSYPHETLALAFKMLFTDDPEGVYKAKKTWEGIGYSLLRLIIGYSISFLLAALLGVLAGLYPRIGDFFKPSVGLMKTVPTVGLVMILFALTLAVDHRYLGWIPVTLVFVVAFPLLFEAFKAGIRNENPDVLDALSLEAGISNPKAVFYVLLPDSLPYIRLGIAQSLGLSFKVLVMAEVLTASNQTRGLGCLIAQSRIVSYDGGLAEIPSYVLIALAIMALIDIPCVLLKRLGVDENGTETKQKPRRAKEKIEANR